MALPPDDFKSSHVTEEERAERRKRSLENKRAYNKEYWKTHQQLTLSYTNEEAEKIRKMARDRDISVAELVREAITGHYGAVEMKRKSKGRGWNRAV